MPISHIGIITSSLRSQSGVNFSHAHDIAAALTPKYKVRIYDMAKTRDVKRLVTDRENDHLDIVFNNAAGKRGGDGSVEGLLSLLNIPFVGSNGITTGIAFDKKVTKEIAIAEQVPTVPGIYGTFDEYRTSVMSLIKRIEEHIGYPAIVKASQSSDSIGITVVRKRRQLAQALVAAFAEDDIILIEKYIEKSQQIDCMILGTGPDAQPLIPVEYLIETEIYSDDAINQLPDCPPETVAAIQQYALQMHRSLKCQDYSRSDFIIDKDGKVYFLELNAHAGLGKNSPTSYITQQTHSWTYEEMIHNILELSCQRQNLI